MKSGRMLAAAIFLATVALIAIGTVWPGKTALAFAGGETLLPESNSPEAAVSGLAHQIGRQAWSKAYSTLANKAEFSESDFVRDLSGSYPSLRTYATLDHFDVLPLHTSGNEATVRLRLHWSTVVGTFVDDREISVVKEGGQWEPY